MGDVFYVHADDKAASLAEWLEAMRREVGPDAVVETLTHRQTGEQVVVCRSPGEDRLAVLEAWAEGWYDEDDARRHGPRRDYCRGFEPSDG